MREPWGHPAGWSGRVRPPGLHPLNPCSVLRCIAGNEKRYGVSSSMNSTTESQSWLPMCCRHLKATTSAPTVLMVEDTEAATLRQVLTLRDPFGQTPNVGSACLAAMTGHKRQVVANADS